ncbi:MAG: AAC(3) family N-acetyltransferase [Clostridium sp.]
MKHKLRLIIRKILKVKECENIIDSIIKKKINIEKSLYKEKYCTDDLKNILERLGINEGDNLFIHSSWRQFYNFIGTPQDVINILKDLVGSSGTIIMPSYGKERSYFDVEKTPSNAGVLSEVFRKNKGVTRSSCTHFSVCSYGKKSEYIICDHFKSKYGFDNNSPCYKFINLDNSKVLLMGLGKKPTKISIFHCVGYLLKDENTYLNKVINKKYSSTLILNNKKYEKKMITRDSIYKNNNIVFRKVIKNIKNKNHIKISNLDLVILDAKEGIKETINFAKHGRYIYKRRFFK